MEIYTKAEILKIVAASLVKINKIYAHADNDDRQALKLDGAKTAIQLITDAL